METANTVCPRHTAQQSAEKNRPVFDAPWLICTLVLASDVEFSAENEKKLNVSMTAVTNGSTRTFNKKMKVAKKMDRMQDWMSPMDQYRMQHSLAAIFCA